MTPEQAVAREAIRYTQSAYHLAGDRGRVGELVENFTEDGVLELSVGSYVGRPAIAERLSQVGGAGPELPPGVRPFLHHHLTTSHLEFVSEREARGLSYFQAMSPVGIDHCGRYADTYVAVGERWLIARRRATVFWAAPDSVVGARV